MANPKCPVHGIPDCSPLLNGCSLLTSPPESIDVQDIYREVDE